MPEDTQPQEGNEDTDASRMLADATSQEGDNSGDGNDGDGNDKSDDDAVRQKIRKQNQELRSLRTRMKELEPLAKKAQELEEASKSELEKANERATGAEGRATSSELRALRLEIAIDQAPEGMPLSKVRQVAKRIQGSTQEELEADAKELFAEFAPASDASTSTNGSKRPKENLPKVPLPNSDNLRLDDETDPRKLAARLPRM